MWRPVDLGFGISLIDLYDLQTAQRTGAYVFHEEEVTIIETSASPSIPHLLKGLEELSIDLKDVKNIIVTHIHLDHAGGAGVLLKHCPNARVFVHPKGMRHLADPSRLIEGAKAVYGEKFDALFDPIVPIPEDRLVIKEDGETLQIGEDRTLTFLHTPGHANHHFSIYDEKSNGIFTGDTAGVFYPQLLSYDVELYLPSTSPNQFDPEAMQASIKRFMSLHPDRIYFGHFGMSTHVQTVWDQLHYWLPIFVQIGRDIVDKQKDKSFTEKTEAVFQLLFDNVQTFLRKRQVPDNADVYKVLQLDLQVCAMGLVDYIEKQKSN
ncbi:MULTISPECIES: MBL fold metallo-hydrolase [Anoxybacillus]|uniref:MBL fold metallo-hydrolase n=1 Tax=Anoxybacillus kestanbolensis TaxID=227476 RepID=A0A1V3FRV4_9BACL|nr:MULTISPECIES: MBL fold metallo-hydrolase [Anoxybacillus]NNU91347.1 MBL fold metallo-hydrolase [Anoxybacillus sp. CHMUD]OOE04452.1 MBL fold metallo-hydrolase [Anoxybacillus kestanbolensis]QAV26768.1 MBL fold metallo-hydrolase [Neobacillus thermocopriae]